MYNNYTYVIVDSLDIVKYQGNDPIWKDENENNVDFFSGKTKYSHEEILNVLKSSEWLQIDE